MELESHIEDTLREVGARAQRAGWAWASAFWTREIKTAIGRLASEFGSDVCANDVPGAKHGEWVFDVTWCGEHEGKLQRLALAFELEWSPEPGGPSEFAKLVQSRAEQRVFVFGADQHDDVRAQFASCIAHVHRYDGSQDGDRYLLAGIDSVSREYTFQRYVHSSRDADASTRGD